MFAVVQFLIGFSLLATIISSLSVFPHQLAYFNELAGGPENGHQHLLGSNLDWGQDLPTVLRWIEDEQIDGPVYIACKCHYNADYIDRRIQPACYGPLIDRDESQFQQLLQGCIPPGTYLISINFLNGDTWHVTGIDYQSFLRQEPIAAVGYTFYAYEVAQGHPRAPQTFR